MIFSWLLVLLVPAFAAYAALRYPIEEHSFDAATFHVYRAVLFSDARAGGDFYPRWIQPINAGLGGPLFTFYSPLAYFALDGLHSLGFPFPIAWRVLVALAMAAASAGVFALVLALSGQAAGALAASAVFVYSFPLLRDYLERGSPEAFSFSLYPWVLWGLVRLIERPSGRRLGFAVVALAAAILSHNLSAMFLIPLFGLVALLLIRRYGWWAVGAPIATLCLCALLTFFATSGFATERDFVRIPNTIANDYVRVAHNSVPLGELLRLPTLFDAGMDNNYNGGPVGPLIGLIAVCGLLAGPILWLKRHRWEALVITGFALAALAVIWLQTASSNAVWESIPALAYVQIRTRLLGLAVLSSAIVVGFLVSMVGERWRSALSYATAAIAIFLALPVLYPQLQHQYATFAKNPTVQDAQAFSLAENVPGFTAFNEFLPIWRKNPFSAEEAQRVARSLFANLPEGARVVREERGSGRAEARIESPTSFDAALHVLYYPGWAGYVDGERRTLKPMEGTGYILLEQIPAGAHTILLRYEGTPAQGVGLLVSAITALGLVLIVVFWRGKKQPIVDLGGEGGSSFPGRTPTETLQPERGGFFVFPRLPQRERVRVRVPGPTFSQTPLGGNGGRVLPRKDSPSAQSDRNLTQDGGESVGAGFKPALAWLLPKAYLKPNWWLLAGLVFLISVKGLWLDPHTTLLRRASSCAEVQGGGTQLNARFGDSLHLCAVDLPERELRPGGMVGLTLYWEATEARQQPADSFVHLLGTALNPTRNNPLWGQQDKQLPGLFPITKWMPGKLYRDKYEFRIDADAPPGEYKLEVGWWQPTVGQRLKPELLSTSDRMAVSDFDSILISGITVH